MDKVNLEKRLNDLREQYQQLLDNGNAVSGAIQFCEILLKEWDAPLAVEPEQLSADEIKDLQWIGPGQDPRKP